jgi:hypothetical protein
MMKKRGYGERNPHQGLPQTDNHEIDRLELLAAVGETCSYYTEKITYTEFMEKTLELQHFQA